MSTGIEAPLANNLLKPAAGLVDALLGPKIEQVKSWTKEKELTKLLSDGSTHQLLRTYLRRLIEKTSELTTIVFPQEKLRFWDIYEPLGLQSVKKRFTPSEPDGQVELDIHSPGRCYFIVDEAGMGKSTYLKSIALRVISKTDKVPLFFELSGYDHGYSLLENLARSLDELDKPFNRDLFNRLLVSGKLFVLLDGYDELTKAEQEKLNPELTILSEKKASASLVISSRPQEGFPTLVGSSTLEIKKLTQGQARALILKYDSVAKLDVGARLLNEFHKIPSRFLETPLLVGLLYRTFGFNNSIAGKVSVFYSEIYDALYKGHDLTKSGYVREKTCGLDIDSFRGLLRSLSFLFILKTNSGARLPESFVDLIDEASKLCAIIPKSSRTYLDDLLVAVPLLARDGKYVKFMHRTIAEYFAAEYLAYADKSSELIRRIRSSGSAESFKQAFEYIYEISPNIYNEAITKPIAIEFLERFETSRDDMIYCDSLFSGEKYFSYWRYRDVLKNIKCADNTTRQSIEFPYSPKDLEGSAFLYGLLNGEEYVACISLRNPRDLPDGILLELAESIPTSVLTIDPNRVKDLALESFADKLEPCRWYELSTPEIAEISHLPAIQEICCRSADLGRRSVQDYLQIITLQKVRAFLDSIASLEKAQADIESLLGGLVQNA